MVESYDLSCNYRLLQCLSYTAYDVSYPLVPKTYQLERVKVLHLPLKTYPKRGTDGGILMFCNHLKTISLTLYGPNYSGHNLR